MGFMHSIWFNQFLRRSYQRLPLPFHVKRILKDTYLGRSISWGARDKNALQVDGNREAFAQVAKRAARFDIEDRWLFIAGMRMRPSDQDPDFLRMNLILEILRENGFRITLAWDSHEQLPGDRTAPVWQDIHILSGFDTARRHLATEGARYHFALLSGIEATFKYLPYVRAYALYSTVVYDTADFRFCPLMDELQPSDERVRIELLNVACADLVTVPAQDERNRLLMERVATPIAVLPYVYRSPPATPSFSQREGLLLSVDSGPEYSVNAAISFVETVLPRILEKLPGLILYIIGRDIPASLKALPSANVELVGFLPDPAAYFGSCRLFVAPFGTGTGMQSMICQSLSHGLPVVSAQFWLEGLDLQNEEHLLSANTEEELVRQVVRLYGDEILWHRLSTKARAYIGTRYSAEAISERMKDIFIRPRNGSCPHERGEGDNLCHRLTDVPASLAGTRGTI